MPLLGLTLAVPIVIGLANGAAIALVAVGLVLIYKSARVFNFAAGEFVTVGAFGAYIGRTTLDLPYAMAMLMGIVAATGAGILTERLVVRPLSRRPRVTVLVATAALAIILINLELMVGGAKPFLAPPLISGKGLRVLGVVVTPQQMLVVLFLAAVGIGLAWFFARTDLGLAVLAASQESTASQLVGIRLNRVNMLTWGLAGFLGGLGGVLVAPLGASFAAGFGTTSVLIVAFTAAVLGGMTSIPGAFVGAVVVGLVKALVQFNVSSETLPGADRVAVLAVLIVILAIRPTGLLGKEA